VDDSSAHLVERWRAGDQQAATALFQRYAEQLLALVRKRLAPSLAPRLDPEDVVQSAYRSFFTGTRNGRFVLERSGDLWHLLAAIAVHKLHHQIAHHTAGKRAVGRETALHADDSVYGVHPEAVARGPTPDEAVAVVDELQTVMRGLLPLHRRMVELYLQGLAAEDIAAATQRTDRMVRLVLAQVKGQLEQRCREMSS
jgi:DNA-directed RNA polymerase specialized sigma24 family protein